MHHPDMSQESIPLFYILFLKKNEEHSPASAYSTFSM
jgi:hypothetical protein